MMRVGVLASGSGSNFQALVDALNRDGAPARVEVLVCNVPGARVLERARAAGVEAVLLEHTRWPTREAYDAAVAEALDRARVDLVCLAGYMRLVTPAFLRRFPGRVINLHPALLPAFPGLHAVRRALAAGVTLSGCTVHFVDEGTDTGPIIAQASVPVLPGDTEATLGARIHAEEHRLYPATVAAIAEGRVRLEGRRVISPERPS
jgi:phosphoribosylglycinamide formyltransferase-1